MNTFLTTVIPTLLTGVLTLAGVYLGSHLAKQETANRIKLETLSNFYSEYFSLYLLLVDTYDEQYVRDLLTASAKIRLFCSRPVELTLDQLDRELLKRPFPRENCDALYATLQTQAKEELVKFFNLQPKKHTCGHKDHKS